MVRVNFVCVCKLLLPLSFIELSNEILSFPDICCMKVEEQDAGGHRKEVEYFVCKQYVLSLLPCQDDLAWFITPNTVELACCPNAIEDREYTM